MRSPPVSRPLPRTTTTTWRSSLPRTTRSTLTVAPRSPARGRARRHGARHRAGAIGYVDLPPHAAAGGFDHAAVHGPRGLLYVAHTANDAVDVIDCVGHKYVRSIPGLPRVAGALVSEADDLVFTSNRGENTGSIFSPLREADPTRVKVGIGRTASPTLPLSGSCWPPTSATRRGSGRSPSRSWTCRAEAWSAPSPFPGARDGRLRRGRRAILREHHGSAADRRGRLRRSNPAR